MEETIKKEIKAEAPVKEAPVVEKPKKVEEPKPVKAKPEPVKADPVATVKNNQLNKPEVKVEKAGHGAPTKASITEMDKILAMVKALPVKSVSRKQYTEMLRLLPLKIQR